MTNLKKTIIPKLNYQFQNQRLLKQALSHRSIQIANNERLEFLGDSILNFIIAEQLYCQYPDLEEGDLSRLRANLINGKILAQLAKELNIGPHLRLGKGEKKSGGAQRVSILSDALEAIIGAIYLDSNIKTVKKCVLTWYQNYLETISIEYKDPKTELQEKLQADQLPHPRYEIIKIEGAAHEQIFHIRCHVAGLKITTLGINTSRRQAEKDAARKFLEKLKNKSSNAK